METSEQSGISTVSFNEEVTEHRCSLDASALSSMKAEEGGRAKLKHGGSFSDLLGGSREKKEGAKTVKTMLPDADEMKRRVRQNLGKNRYNVHDFYYKAGVCQAVARHHIFEKSTLVVIVANALYMALDTDLNTATELNQAHAIFQVGENLFCIFFTGELLIRFGAFDRKCNCLRDAWFVFDSVLVFTMVLETWVMAYLLPVVGLSLSGGGMGNAGVLRLLRLLRLSRMSRMARLLRSVPELMILLKGMGQAASSCMWTAMLIVIAMFIWSLALKQLSSDTPLQEKYFSSIPDGMYNLMITGCFMKGFNIVMYEMKEESILCLLIYFVFVLFSGVTVMKMLTGMLCKVINAVAQTETEKMCVGFVRDEILAVLFEMGSAGDAVDVHSIDVETLKISQTIFAEMMNLPRAIEALRKIGIDVVGLVTAADFIFPEVSKELTAESEDFEHHHEHLSLPFVDFMENILQLRGSNTATVKDALDMRKFVRSEVREIEQNLRHLYTSAGRKSENSGRSGSKSFGELPAAPAMSSPPRDGVTAESVYQNFSSLSQADRTAFFFFIGQRVRSRCCFECQNITRKQ